MNSALKQLPIVEGLFTESSDNPQLIGGKCNGCNTYFFPFKPEVHAPTCNHREAERVKLTAIFHQQLKFSRKRNL